MKKILCLALFSGFATFDVFADNLPVFDLLDPDSVHLNLYDGLGMNNGLDVVIDTPDGRKKFFLYEYGVNAEGSWLSSLSGAQHIDSYQILKNQLQSILDEARSLGLKVKVDFNKWQVPSRKLLILSPFVNPGEALDTILINAGTAIISMVRPTSDINDRLQKVSDSRERVTSDEHITSSTHSFSSSILFHPSK